MEAELVVELVVPDSPERVGAARTTPSSARRWLKAEGFGLELRRRFTVQLPGGSSFDGRVTAEIVGVEAGRRLDWSWTGGPVVGQVTCGEPAVVVRDGRVWLAWNALPAPDAPWRRLYVADITDAL